MKIEILVAVVAAFAAMVSAALAYTAQERATKAQADVSLIQLATQQAHERQKPFIEAQMKYYVEATETAAKIARTPEGPARDDLIKRFWQLYWGTLALVEDDEVAQAMIAYGKALGVTPKQTGELETHALRVAHACRNSLKSLWVPQLGSVQAERPAPLPKAKPIAVLKFLMREHSIRQSDLPEIGSQGVVSEVLAGKRELNTRQIKRLAKRFGVSAEVFI